MKSTFALALVLLTSASAAFAKGENYQVGGRIGGGRDAEVYSIQHSSHPKHTVLKLALPGVWRGKRLYVRDEKTLRGWADKVVTSTKALHGDAKSGEWFRSIVPGAVHDEKSLPGWVLLQPRQGQSISQLHGGARDTAKAEMKRAITTAKKILGGEVNEDEDNFMFDSRGQITGWVSVIPQPKGTATPYERESDQTMGPGVNSVVFKVKNLDSKEKRGWVVKIMMPNASGRSPGFASLPMLRELSDTIVTMTGVVQKDRVLKKYGKVFPDAIALVPGVLVQEEVKGVSYDRMGSGARQRADGDWGVVRARLQHLFPGQLITAARQRDRHVAHEADGSINKAGGVFDPLVDSAHKYPGGVRPKLVINDKD